MHELVQSNAEKTVMTESKNDLVYLSRQQEKTQQGKIVLFHNWTETTPII